ncbi:putative SAM-dependent methyltransferase [Streptomyces pseudovenezuelae]|uniref:SAM-dependent methyltransferase n=1 Tax=Streptomyces pseudovenezuelae TaxID=67350 RepID=A0ABT6M2W6_9ACTN|nr:putative SAM-dependent methyltransferase [Streptomyces pseudovenezuelae]
MSSYDICHATSGPTARHRAEADAPTPDLDTYVPLDVRESALTQAGHTLLAERPGLTAHALIGDFTAGLYLPGTPRPRLIAFLGGTIGNLLPVERAGLLSSLRSLLFPGDGLLLGVDLVKDEATLVAAYDDREGVTAAFNKNVLTVINRELDAAFDPATFDHVAVWDPRQEWIEMRLRSRIRQRVKIAALDLIRGRYLHVPVAVPGKQVLETALGRASDEPVE